MPWVESLFDNFQLFFTKFDRRVESTENFHKYPENLENYSEEIDELIKWLKNFENF